MTEEQIWASGNCGAVATIDGQKAELRKLKLQASPFTCVGKATTSVAGATALERLLRCLQAVKVGQEAVAEQCRAIDGWREEVGKPKQQPSPVPTAALEAKIESLCRDRMEQVYKSIKGATARNT